MKMFPERAEEIKPKTMRTERELVSLLVAFLSESGYRVRLEVPNMGQCADVVGTRNRWVTFFEAKTRDWSRALKQCKAHESVADYVCLAIAMRSVPERLRGQLEESGYGLIVCDMEQGRCEWSVMPRRNEDVWLPQRRRLAAAMKEIEHEH
jgi:hypothetical protein